MAQKTISASDYVSDALLTKSNDNDTELYLIKAEVEAARGGQASLLAKQDVQDLSIAALASGSGVVVSANDTTAGYLNGKLLGTTEQIVATENNDGANETLTLSIPEIFLKKHFLL